MEDEEEMDYGDEYLIKELFGLSKSQFIEYKFNVANGFLKFGDNFLVNLSRALLAADLSNSIKIMHAFRKECAEHELLYRICVAKETTISIYPGYQVVVPKS